MSQSARVGSIDALKSLRAAMAKFADAAAVALGDAESEMQRMQTWLETEQLSHWQSQHRKRTEAVSRAKDAVRQKRIFKDSTGRPQSAVDEEKALRIAQRQLEEAEHKLAMVKKYGKLLPREIELYKGSVQRFATTIQSGIPRGIHGLDRMVMSLEAYVSVAPPSSATSTADSAASGSAGPTEQSAMTRPEPVPEIPAEPQTPGDEEHPPSPPRTGDP